MFRLNFFIMFCLIGKFCCLLFMLLIILWGIFNWFNRFFKISILFNNIRVNILYIRFLCIYEFRILCLVLFFKHLQVFHSGRNLSVLLQVLHCRRLLISIIFILFLWYPSLCIRFFLILFILVFSIFYIFTIFLMLIIRRRRWLIIVKKIRLGTALNGKVHILLWIAEGVIFTDIIFPTFILCYFYFQLIF